MKHFCNISCPVFQHIILVSLSTWIVLNNLIKRSLLFSLQIVLLPSSLMKSLFAFILYNLLNLSAEYNLSLGIYSISFFLNKLTFCTKLLLKRTEGILWPKSLILQSVPSSCGSFFFFFFCGCEVSFCMLAESCWVTVSGAWWLADSLPCGFLPSQVTWLTSQDTSSVTCLTIFTAVLQIW